MSSALPRAARRGLADEAADLVRAAIFSGHFPPGAALREVELAERLGVSRGSVREGLARLDREGLVRGGWHRGTTVIEVAAEDVQEVYALRAALDRLAATTARRAATAEHLSRLDRLVDEMTTEIAGGSDAHRLVALDIAFHDQVYAAAGNGRLTTAWQAIRSQLHLFQLRRVDAAYDHYRARVVDEHRELAALLRSGDSRTLARRAEEHVDSARRSLLTSLPTRTVTAGAGTPGSPPGRDTP
ncbi:GntR family transcriptional regulator [Streptomyces sp. NPDC014623]|uniref:GntR family transcriptional regulator n=1 Tax=Streptomyces sp. NPDC014623 TaxID=3364875 RepID=UPI0036FA529B